jgi:hypothetical protein
MGSVMAVTLGQNFSTLRPTSEGSMYTPHPLFFGCLDEKGYCVAETFLSVLGNPERLGQTKCIWNNQFSKFPCSFIPLSDSNSGQA